MKINEVILHPILTEKATKQAQLKMYTFEVSKKATKHQIKHAIESIYGVKIMGLQVLLRKGKEKRVGRRMKSKILPNRKIAVIKVKEGTINLFPQL